MKNIKPRYFSVLLLAFCLLASFTHPVKKIKGNLLGKNIQSIDSFKLSPLVGLEKAWPPPISSIGKENNARDLTISQIVSNSNSVSTTAQGIDTKGDRIFHDGLVPISPLPVRPLPIKIAKRLIDFKRIEPVNKDNLFEKEYYIYDSDTRSFKKFDKIKTSMGFDPIRFTLNANKDSIAIGEEFEIKITAEFLDVSPALMFQFEGSNGFTLKMLFPDSFVMTGGTYYDFVQGKVTRENPKQEFIIKGYFATTPKLSTFRLLRSFTGATTTDIFEKKKELFVPIYENNLISKNQVRLSSNNQGTFLQIFKNYQNFDNLLGDCGYIPPPTITSSQTFCTSLTVNATCSSTGYNVQWSDGINGGSRVLSSTYTNLSARCIETSSGCLGEYAASATYTLSTAPAAPTLSTSGTPACIGGTVKIYADYCPTDKIYWSNGATNVSSIDAPAGTYTATCKNDCNQESVNSNTIVITNYATPSDINVTGSNVVCSIGETVTLTASACNYTVKWYVGGQEIASGQTYNAGVGSYVAKCVNTNCQNVTGSAGNWTISQDFPPTPVHAGDDKYICDGTTTSLEKTGCDGGMVTWKMNGATVSPNNVGVGVYVVECTGFTCTNGNTSDEIVVHSNGGSAPPITLTNIGSVCGSNTRDLGYSGCTNGSVYWYKNNVLIANGNGATGGNTYKVICSLGNGCGDTSDSYFVANTGDCFNFTVSSTRGSCSNTINLSGFGCPATGIVTWSIDNFASNEPHATGNFSSISINNYTSIWGRCKDGNEISTKKVGDFSFYPSVSIPDLSNLTSYGNSVSTNGSVKTITACVGNSLNIGGVSCQSGESLVWHNSLLPTMPSNPDPHYYATCRNDITGCEGSNSGIYLQLSPVTPVFPAISAAKESICIGESVILTAAVCTNGQLTWSTGANTQSITVSPTQSTQYSATCSYTGCSLTDYKTITVNPLPTTIATNQAACEGVTVTLSKNQDVPGENYIWKNSAGTVIPNGIFSNISISQGGTYTLIATSQPGCSKTSTSILTVNAKPVISTSVNCDIITVASTYTNLEKAYISGPSNQNSDFTNNGSGTFLANFNSLPAGQYSIYAKSTFGCQSESTDRTIGPSSAGINFTADNSTGSKTICNGTSLTLGITTSCPLSYSPQWVDDANAGFPRTITFNEANFTSRTYQVKCVGNSGGCTLASFSNILIVNINYVDVPTSIEAKTICLGGTVNLGGSCGSNQVRWFKVSDNSEVTQTVSPTTDTYYYAKCSKTLNSVTCTSNQSSSIKVTVNSIPQATVSCSNCDPATTTNDCPANDGYPKAGVGHSIQLSGTCSVGTPSWTGPDGFTSTNLSPTVTNANIEKAGTYILTCTTTAGCTSTASTNITVYPNCALAFKGLPAVNSCVAGVSSITTTVCNITPTKNLFYQLERRNADNSFTVVIPYTDAGENANGTFTIPNIAIEGTYRIKIKEVPISSEVGDQLVCEPSPSPDLNIFCPCNAAGFITYDRWNNISGNAVSDLTTNPAYLQTPNVSYNLNDYFEAKATETGDSFGARIRGFICAPTDGTYYFYIAGDDQVELWLSSDANPANKQLIAFHRAWTGTREYTKYPTQKSAGIQLQANRKYYVEALMKESVGDQNFSVAWTLPTTNVVPTTPIPAAGYLSPFSGCYLSAISDKTENTIIAGQSVTLTASGGTSTNYVWKLNGTTVGTGSSITVNPTVTSTYLLTCSDCTNCVDGAITINVIPTLNGCVKITALHSSKSLYIDNVNNSSTVKQGAYNSLSSQIWQLESAGGDLYKIHSFKNSKVIESENNVVRMYDVRTGYNQSWQLPFLGANTFQIVNPVDSKVFDVSGVSMDDGALIQLYTNNGSDNQKFRIETVTCPVPEGANCIVDNKVTYERWDNIAGYSTADLTSNPRYIGNHAPDILSIEPVPNGLNIQNSTIQNFGARIRGYICPPLVGGNNYTFYLTSDNSSKVWLSTTSNPANKVEILSKDDNGNPDDASQHNVPAVFNITLIGGQKYYFEIIHKQWISSSFVKLEWEAPDLSKQVISGNNLEHFEPVPYNLPTLCGFDLKTGAGYTEDIPSDIKLGDYIAVKAIASSASPGTFNWTTIIGGNDYYAAAPTTGSVGTNTSTANPVFIKPNNVGSYTYRVTLTKSDGTGSCITDIKLNVTTTTCGACTDCGPDGNLLSTVPYPTTSASFTAANNYVVEKTYLKEDATKYTQQVTYLDGIGRPVQKIAIGITADEKDLVSPIIYDSYGRESKKYLPYTATTNGAIQANPIAASESFYNTLKQDANVFAETVYEKSPLQRVLQQGSVGADWQISSNHTGRFIYRTNVASEIYYLSYNFTTNKVEFVNNTYTAGKLAVVEATDENNNVSIEYKDFSGNTVCKKSGLIRQSNGTLSGTAKTTYYVFDDLGLLRAVFSPEATNTHLATANGTIDAFDATISELLFAYDYDERHRLKKKKTPDAAAVTMAYDDLDRVISVTKPKSSGGTEVITTVYDGLNRVLETKLDAATLTKNFYDNYTWQTTEGVAGDLAFSTFNSVINYTQVKGGLTGTKTAVMSPAAGMQNFTYTTSYINYRGQAIQVRSKNQTGGVDVVSSIIDFAGRVSYVNNQIGLSTPLISEQYMGYDKGGRAKSICQRIGGSATGTYWEPVARYEYNALGELTQKKLGCDIQRVDYLYNIRGWLKTINNVDDMTTDKDFFAMRLSYAQNAEGGTSPAITPQYNGNIAKQEWRYANRKGRHIDPFIVQADTKLNNYYTYDELDRLLTATMTKGSDDIFKLENLSYDRNGNILTLKRSWKAATPGATLIPVDNLTYTYETRSNRLKAVSDGVNYTNTTNDEFFKDVAGATDYTYDALGNILSDANKSITGIIYNHNSLPTQIKNSTYTYNAGGSKLRMKVADTAGEKTYDYYGGAVLVNNAIEFVPTAEGRILPPNRVLQNFSNPTAEGDTINKFWRYEYQIKDHLGNLRVACRCAEQAIETKPEHGYPAIVTQQATYDPWGLKLAMSTRQDGGNGNPTDRFRYNGKEYQKDHGMYEYGFRWYDAAIARFIQVDPLANDYAYKSTYDYAENEPISNIDLDGAEKLKTINGLMVTYDKASDNPNAKKDLKPLMAVSQAKPSEILKAYANSIGLAADAGETIAERFENAYKMGDNNKFYTKKFFGNQFTKPISLKGIKDIPGKVGLYADGVVLVLDGYKLYENKDELSMADPKGLITGTIKDGGIAIIGNYVPMAGFTLGFFDWYSETPAGQRAKLEADWENYRKAIKKYGYGSPRVPARPPEQKHFLDTSEDNNQEIRPSFNPSKKQ